MNALWKLLIISAALAATTAAYAQQTASPSAEIGRARIAKLTLEPLIPRTGDRLKAKIKFGEETVRAEVKWAVNDEEVEQYDFLEAMPYGELERPIKAGDNVRITVIPYDAQNVPGKTVVQKVSVNKAPPSIQLGEQKIQGNVYQAKVTVSSLEDDLPSVKLDQGPPGMTIDKNGLITWKFSDTTAGKFDIKVSAKDKSGTEAILTYSFIIRRTGQ